MSENISIQVERSTTKIDARRASIRRLGTWSVTRRYDVLADHSRVVLDLREPCRRFTRVDVDVALARTTLILLVGDDVTVEESIEWTGRGRLKGRTDGGRARVVVSGTAHRSEVRLHRAGAAAFDDLTSWSRLQELRASEGGSEVEHVPVLIVGGGYAGTAMALFLAHNGIRALMVDRHDGPSVQGRARGVNERTMELYRSLGLDREVEALSAPFAGDAGVARCASLAEPWEWLFDPEPDPRLAEISPASLVMADQSAVEPVLTRRARELGATIQRGVVADEVAVDENGAEVTLRTLADGSAQRVRADYLLAADGYAGRIRDTLAIRRDGPGEVEHWASIVFDAQLDDLVQRRPLFWIVLNQQLGFAALTTTAQPDRWSLGLTYDPDTSPLESFDEPTCVRLVRAALGDPDREVRILDVTPWQQAVGVAERYRQDRAFLIGDAAHVWPPAGGLGANSGIQDAHNLAWKLAAVLDGRAAAGLLDTYDAERRPVAVALADLTVRRQAARFGGAAEDDVNDLVCVFGQRYDSAAVLHAQGVVPFDEDVAQVAEAGARMPHRWLDTVHRTSILDRTGSRFVLAVADRAEQWRDAVGDAPIGVEQVDRDVLGDAAVALIRPDGYVAWTAVAEAASLDAVLDAVQSVLGRGARARHTTEEATTG